MSRPVISYPIPSPNPPPGAPVDNLDDQQSQQAALGTNTGHSREGSGLARSVSGQTRGPASTLDSFITRLLVVTKQLLQGLEQWSQRQLTEEDVSDIYVRLGNGFELCVSAFRKVGISTADLDSVPNDLRVILERALGEEPSTETLNMYLPDIRAIIFNLLSGLKNKQIAYKRLIADRNQPDVFNASSSRPASKPSEPDPSRSVPSSNRSDRTASPVPVPSVPLPAAALAERTQQRQNRPAPPDAFRPPRSRSAQDSHSPHDQSPRRTSLSSHRSSSQMKPAGARPLIRTPPTADRYSRDAGISRFSDDSDTAESRRASDASSLHNSLSLRSPPAIPPPTLPTIPISPPLPTLNLPPDHVPTDVPNDAAVALQRSDALERRASKRFSSYTFNKMVPASSPSAKRTSTSGSPPRPARRSDRLPAVIEDRRPPLPDLAKSLELVRKASVSPKPTISTLETIPASPSIEVSCEAQQRAAPGAMSDLTAVKSKLGRDSLGAASSSSSPSSVTAYLQLGRQVKKTLIDLPTDMSTLKLLFMERFEYDPGMEDFPDVYIRDNKTGVQYELEDLKDLQEGCILTLDIEPLDQVKQHFDLTFASLSAEIKELKSALTQPKRLSTVQPLASSLLSVSPSQPRVPLETPDQTMVIHSSPRSPQEASTPTASNANLQLHYDEVQSLRRDLAIMRQLHLDFISQTKESFGALREQNTAMREVVKTKMGGSRALLDNSKAKLEAQCQDTIQSVEEVSDIIDGAREDALRRGITPSKSKMGKIREDLTKATALVETFTTDVGAAEPTWRATWLTELQRVTEEQRLLAYQNKLAADLKNDIKDATEMLDNVQAFVDQRKTGGRAKQGRFVPSSPDEGGGGISNLLMEIRTKEADPSQRLRAIEEQQRARERELATRTDDFQNELSGFVEGKKLKKTGGTDEAERVRQRRQEQTLRRMLSGDIPGEPTGVLAPTPQRRTASDGGARNSGTSSAGAPP